MPVWLITTLAMLAFAANSLLCRFALGSSATDPASFTSLRVISGAAMLGLIVAARGERVQRAGSWISALALFAYAAGFSFAYITLSTGTGALLLFGAVQATMIGWGIARGERPHLRQWSGILLALAGFVALALPGATAPSPAGSVLMVGAGIAWGVYSLRGRNGGDPTRNTAGNFLRAVPFTVVLSAILFARLEIDLRGGLAAVASGALTSGVGYVIWYAALPRLNASTAATVQLSVPVIAALAGLAFLGEAVTLRLVVASAAILGGIGLVTIRR